MAFLFLLILAALATVVVIRRQKKGSEFSSKCTNKLNNTPKGKHHALPSSTPEVVEKEGNKIVTSHTETIDNIAYEGATFNSKEIAETTCMQHSDGKSNDDVGVYESIRFEQSYMS